ncbi:MAG: Polyketide cyclase / dehydrase and lipid transport [Acidimicrobiaceae bacterium]|nr:Polyketide cyclase / dehydrase and lipid transport [Acidimicrobiaceae bacterium]
MGKINRSTVVGCPPDRVFAVLSQVERLADFSSMTVDIRNGPGRPVQVGDHFEQVVKVLGKELDTEWEVVEVQAHSLLRFEGTASAGARATLVERLTAEGTGTRVELDVDYDLPLGILGDAVDAVYLQSKNEEQAEEILGKLKALCETTP